MRSCRIGWRIAFGQSPCPSAPPDSARREYGGIRSGRFRPQAPAVLSCPASRVSDNRPRRVSHLLATIHLQQIDRLLLAAQRALLNENGKATCRERVGPYG